MKNYKIFALSILLTVFAGCRSSHMTELQRFERSVLKELPFSVDSISWLTSGDFPTFRFANTEYIGPALMQKSVQMAIIGCVICLMQNGPYIRQKRTSGATYWSLARTSALCASTATCEGNERWAIAMCFRAKGKNILLTAHYTGT